MNKQLVVIGGGAAGFFCAVNAARMNSELKVLIIEKTGKLLSKVKVSGGGRCNVTHACFDRVAMSKEYPRGQHFVKKAFHRFFTTDTIQWFEERGVKLKTETDGRMFPVTDTSQTIIDCLLKESNKYGVEIMTKVEVIKINIPLLNDTVGQEQSIFNIQFSDGRVLQADFVCIASGGYPKSSMFNWLAEMGHSVEEPVPSLFTFNLPAGQTGMPGHPITKLMGVSVENVKVKIAGSKLEQEGPLLITHWGFSGPAILKLSAWGATELAVTGYKFKILINWLPVYNEQQLAKKIQDLRIEMGKQKFSGKNPFGLPQRLWDFLLDFSDINKEIRWAELRAKEANRLIRNLSGCEFNIKGKTTFKEEFVTAGGIKLNEVDANTMMSKKVANIFFAGEVLDVDGVTGGFNFQHAWTSGWIAANKIAGLSQ